MTVSEPKTEPRGTPRYYVSAFYIYPVNNCWCRQWSGITSIYL